VVSHASVLLAPALELLAVKDAGIYVDGTLGLGGHAEAILEKSAPTGRVLGVDKDEEALLAARARLLRFGDRLATAHADFREIPALLAGRAADGILLDLGVSSFQLDSAERGFSFLREGPLDMRMDRGTGSSAAELLRRASERELCDWIHDFGEEPRARRVARAIVEARRQQPIRTTLELARVVRGATLRGARRGIDPATRTFQALRIVVNHELDRLQEALVSLAGCLARGGRLVVIAFHSLEDREVKHAFRGLAGGGFTVLTRKPLRPSMDEVSRNPRARSARLRALEKVGEAA
jgi:16S rRNA (cytosine1402-N4)-methyltransferase